jgi:enoyl-CoA hydratase/carnithine racemase
MTQTIMVERDGHVTTVVINRPTKRNALDQATWSALGDTMQTLDGDDAIRCVVVRGAADTFSAGADISEFERVRRDVAQAKIYGAAEHAAVSSVAGCRHPTVALIQGACVGGGLEIASACDVRICGASSRFGVPVNRLGLTMAYEELKFFCDVVGRSAALAILLEGQVFGAERAREVGLVHRVVSDEGVEAEALETAGRIAAGAPLVNRWHKRFVRRLADPRPLTQDEIDEGYAAFATEDYRIGYRAFLDKDPPEFVGR